MLNALFHELIINEFTFILGFKIKYSLNLKFKEQLGK